jgi:serine/threonine-protein kinase HipA
MTSEPLNSLFVWIWLPGASEPVVAGRLDRRGDRFVFSYGRSYHERPGAVAIYLPELPLDQFEHEPLDGSILRPIPTGSCRYTGRRYVCDLARLTLSQRRTLMGGPVLNDYIFYAH